MRQPLTAEEILELDDALTEAFAAHRALRNRIPAARYIKFPPVPAILSESLLIATAQKLFGPDWKAAFGGSLSDVKLSDSAGRTRRVEVKATARHEFQELKGKDLAADILVWVRFGKRFDEGGSGTIRMVLLDHPGNHISEPIRLDIPRLMERVGASSALREIEVSNLKDFLLSPAGSVG